MNKIIELIILGISTYAMLSLLKKIEQEIKR